MEEENTNETAGNATSNEAGALPVNSGWRDHIVDRTGDLLRESVAAAEEMGRAVILGGQDPRDGTQALLVVTRDGVVPLPANTFDQYRNQPIRRTGTAQLTRLEGFIDHVLRFKSTNTVIFARDDATSPRLTAVYDYHPEGPNPFIADNGGHKAVYAFPLSDEWNAWFGANGKAMAMTDFAQFLEDHIVDVVDSGTPSSAAAQAFVKKTGGNFASSTRLIDISRNLQVHEASTLREARNLSSGEAEVIFTTDHMDAHGNKLVLPNLFMIAIPVFAKSPTVFQMLARFRYRKNNGSLVFWFELWRPDLVFEEAFSESLRLVCEQTGVPLFVGSPEA